jgi:hypothetical protein
MRQLSNSPHEMFVRISAVICYRYTINTVTYCRKVSSKHAGEKWNSMKCQNERNFDDFHVVSSQLAGTFHTQKFTPEGWRKQIYFWENSQIFLLTMINEFSPLALRDTAIHLYFFHNSHFTHSYIRMNFNVMEVDKYFLFFYRRNIIVLEVSDTLRTQCKVSNYYDDDFWMTILVVSLQYPACEEGKWWNLVASCEIGYNVLVVIKSAHTKLIIFHHLVEIKQIAFNFMNVLFCEMKETNDKVFISLKLFLSEVLRNFFRS